MYLKRAVELDKNNIILAKQEEDFLNIKENDKFKEIFYSWISRIMIKDLMKGYFGNFNVAEKFTDYACGPYVCFQYFSD
ncbi:MAG: hypothetical protein Q8930_14130 [Bacillota bacterium]|nr:hypothetical protein [Bacillota bacterium]